MTFFTGPSRRQHGDNVVTYRHLLSASAMTPFNPLRTIGHCDIDGAFAQFEQVRLGLPDDVPLICIQWNSIIAVNYPARAYGIKRDMSAVAANTGGATNHIEEAKKRCPGLVVQHVATYREGEDEAGYWPDVDRRTHKVSLDPYRRESLKILAVFREMAPKAELEKASIDEAFMDLTPMVVDRLLAAHPHLATVPDDAPDGLDSPLPPAPPIDWSKAGNVIPIQRGEEDSHEEGEEVDTWQDWALCLGAEIMAEVRAEVWKRLHYTCSAGIAHNKAMAKICSAWKKPNAQTVLREAATPGFLYNMKFTDIRFLGGKLGNAIAEEFGATTVGDLLTVSLDDMQAKFGEESIWVYNIIRGIDHTEVKEKLATKSMLASKNTIPNVRTSKEGHHWLSVLAGELNVRLREAREVTPGLWPKTLVLSTRTAGEASRSRQGPFPFTRNLSPEYIAKVARKLWDESMGQAKNLKLSNIGIAFTGLEKLEEGQQGIEGFFSAGQREKRPREEGVKEEGGKEEPEAKRKPTVVPEVKPKRTALDTFLARGEAPKRDESPIVIIDDEEGKPAVNGPNGTTVTDDGATWKCPRCETTLTAPADDLLLPARQEHEDYHFALDLQASDGGGGSSSNRGTSRGPSTSTSGSGGSRGRTGSAKPAKSKKNVGIKAFFAPK